MSVKIINLEHIFSPGTPFETMDLRNINLEIADNSLTAIIGQTGSGKSTLIQHFNGLMLPTTGEVFVNGLDTRNKKERHQIRSQVGIVFQYPEHQLFEETVEADICFGPKNMGITGDALQQRLKKALQAVSLPETILSESPFDLSGGQMRRVAIAGVLAMEPEILVLDEPTAGLDPVARRSILNMIDRIRDNKDITIILVTHDMEEVAQYANRVIVMNKGLIALDGTPREVFAATELLREIGLDVPPITALFQQLRSKGWDLPEVVLTIEEASMHLSKALGVTRNA